MQYIDDDMDMDELFKKAAEDYPLNTNSADWNEVLRKLSVTDPEQTIPAGDKKNYKRLLLLLLLLPISWLGYEYFNSNNQFHKNSNTDKNISKNISTPSAQANTAISENINSQPAIALQVLPGNNNLSTISQGNKNIIQYKQKARIRSVVFAPQPNNTIADQSPSALKEANKKEETITVDNNENKISIKNNTENIIITQQDNDKKENTTTNASVKTKKEKPKNEHGIYAGIIFSPDISTVKLQSIKKTGNTIGLLIGYRFNKKISVESGLAWNKKYYYSDGGYFNTKNIVLPANAKIINLDGVCKMIEVPVTIKYDFKSSVKTNLSVSGGVSSYFMKSENYNYNIEHTGVQYPRSATYKNSSTNLLAVATIGFGYNRNLGKKTTLRLEPYIKIPLTGVGIGKLPIMSSGMNIGITKKLF